MKIDENNTKKLCFLDADGKQSLKDGFFISGQQFWTVACIPNKCVRCLEVNKLHETAIKRQFMKWLRYFTKLKKGDR